MFDGVPDQFHHFIASSRTSLPIPFPFPLHATTSPPPPPPPQTPPPPPLATTFPTFDPYPSHQTLQPHHHHHPPPKNEPFSKEDQTTLLSTSLVLERERSAPDPPGPWSNEEVLALLRIRSTMDNWFPDFSWEHVSRKLGELGFKRSADKCKERFEEENRNLNNISSFNKNFRFFSELDELYQPGNQKINQNLTQNPPRRQDNNNHQAQSLEEAGSGNVDHNNNNNDNNDLEENEEVFMMQRSSTTSSKCNTDNKKSRSNKRKRKFEMFKGFCEAIVERVMAQQEELHNKIIEDMMKREEEKIARDEAWKSQEMDRLNKEIETREKEHEMASNRQAKIIEFLNKFASNSSQNQVILNKLDDLFEVANTAPDSNPSATHCSTQLENELVSTKKSKKNSHHHHHQNPSPNNPTQPTTKTPILPSTSSTMDLAPQNPTSHESKDTQNEGGKRWPREEVLALINLRCSLNNNNNNDNSNKEGAKGPLWEKISQGMQELGYKRSAKRCKEKWENINKYFRKTKDNNKKRSLDSRTCPYFHQLSTLYGSQQGKIREDSPENRSDN